MNKQLFFDSISNNNVFDETFFKKVYGYSICDSAFIHKVSDRLKQLGRTDAILSYNKWYQEYLSKENDSMRSVSEWYIKRCEEWYQRKYKKVIKQNEYRDRYKFTGFSQDF